MHSGNRLGCRLSGDTRPCRSRPEVWSAQGDHLKGACAAVRTCCSPPPGDPVVATAPPTGSASAPPAAAAAVPVAAISSASKSSLPPLFLLVVGAAAAPPPSRCDSPALRAAMSPALAGRGSPLRPARAAICAAVGRSDAISTACGRVHMPERVGKQRSRTCLEQFVSA